MSGRLQRGPTVATHGGGNPLFGTLLLREIRDHLYTARVGLALAGMGVLAVVVALVGASEYARRVDGYREAVAAVERELDAAHVYSQVAPDLIRPPQVLSVFCQGVDRTAGQRYVGGIYEKPAGLRHVGDAGNDLMKDFVGVDFTGVVLTVFSFVAVILGHGAIAGEREDGTLAAVLANPVPRAALIGAKLLGGWIVVCLPLTVSFVAAAVVVSLEPAVVLQAADWIRLGFYLVLCALFLATVYALSVMVSTLTRRAATALVVCLLGWLVGGVGYLNGLPFVAQYGIEIIPYEVFMVQQSEVYERLSRELREWGDQHPEPPPAYMQWRYYQGIVRYGHPRAYAWLQAMNAFRQERQVDAAEEVYRYRSAAFEPLARMAHAVDRWAVLSPLTNFAALARRLARTTLDDNFHFLRAGHEYRGTYLQYLRSHDAFGSRRWFSDDPDDQEPLIPHPESVTEEMLHPGSEYMQARTAWAEEQERRAEQDPRRRLDLSGLPAFPGQGQRSLSESLVTMAPGLAVMLLSLALAAVVAVARMERYDPRP